MVSANTLVPGTFTSCFENIFKGISKSNSEHAPVQVHYTKVKSSTAFDPKLG